MSVRQAWSKLLGVKTAGSKYHNQASDGFGSQRERRRWAELNLLQAAGVISGLKRQVNFTVVPAIQDELPVVYRADFVYLERGVKVVEDVKPEFKNDKQARAYHATGAYRTFVIKRKLMLAVYNIKVREV